METHQLLGLVLVAMGVMDLPLAWFVSQKIDNPPKRQMILLAMGMSSLFLIGLGVAFFFRLIPV